MKIAVATMFTASAFIAAPASMAFPLNGTASNAAAKPDDQAESKETVYKVVMNSEEQYSIWPADRELPLGWSDAGVQGTEAECLAYIEKIRTDMRPLSQRQPAEPAEQD